MYAVTEVFLCHETLLLHRVKHCPLYKAVHIQHILVSAAEVLTPSVVLTCNFSQDSVLRQTPVSIYYKAECKQIYPQWFYLNQGGFPFREGHWSLLLNEALNRICVKFCDTRVSQVRSTRMMAPSGHCTPCLSVCSLCLVVVCCVPPIESGIECDLLSPSFLLVCIEGWCTARWICVQSGGETENMACPPQQMWMLSVSQRFSYSLLLKLVP